MLMKLTNVTVNKYKSILKSQSVEIEPDITTIVGMNESGKTSFLQAIAKTNYFNSDKDFKFDITQDYPRNKLVDFENSGEDEEILSCTYLLSDELLNTISNDLGKGVFTTKIFSFTYHYKGSSTVSGIAGNEKNI